MRAFETVLFLEYDMPDFQENDEMKFSRTDTPEFGLTILVQRENNGLGFRALFDRTLYTPPVIQRMMNHFRNMFLALLDPKCDTVAGVRGRMLDHCESMSLTTRSSSLMTPYIGPRNLKECFEEGIDQWPHAVAIESEDRLLTYSELDQLTNHIGGAVADRVRPGSAVAILSDRSLEWIVAVLAVIKAGAAYVPLHVDLPLERMKTMARTAETQLTIFPRESAWNRFSESFDGQKILLDDILASIGDAKAPRLLNVPKPEDVAYITFTSGSTGVPKGVRIKHQSVVSYLSYGPARMDARPGRRHAQMFSPGFDVNQAEIFGSLCYGATLVLADPVNPFAHLSRVNATMITPSFLSVCEPGDYPNLDTILFAGEAVPQVLADRWAGTRTVYNSYGPCECTIGCLFQQLQPYKEVTLGHSIPRVGVYLLDSYKQPVPIGLPGEIWLSGIQVADGYTGADLDALSQSRFIANPFVPGQQLYRTGDCAIWTEHQELKFLGRFDNQVKVRGYRVELNEIENVIRQVASDVRRAAAIVSVDNIVAFVEPDSVDVSAIDIALRAKLPSYECPAKIVALSSLPTMPNQKLDRKELQSKVALTSRKAHEPLNIVQSVLAEAWREARGLSKDVEINIDTDFLEIGGNSISQIKVAQIVSRKLGLKVPLRIFIWNTKLSVLGDKIDEWRIAETTSTQTAFNSAWKLIEGPFTSVSRLEKEFVYLSSQYPPQTFNVAFKLRLTGSLDLERLERAIEFVTFREPLFKSRFYEIDGQVLRGQSHLACELTRDDLDECGLTNFINKPFNLPTGPLTRVNTVQKCDKTEIVFVQHHVITGKDGVKILLKNICKEYLKSLGNECNVAERPSSLQLPNYTIWAQWKAGQPRLSMQDQNVAYWKARLADQSVPLWKTLDAEKKTFEGRSETFTIKEISRSSKSLEFYLALITMALAKVCGVNDLIIGIPHIDRTEPETENLLGVFLDRLPIRMTLDTTVGLEDFPGLIESARTSIQNALAHSIPLADIRNSVGTKEIFQVMLVHNRREDMIANSFEVPGVKVDDLSLRPMGAKFPLLIEITEGEENTSCDFEYMENVVNPEIAAGLRLYIERFLSNFC